jgi:hypothetical protein
MKGIQVCTKIGPGPFQRGDNGKNEKNGVWSFKNLFQNSWTKFNQTWHKSSLGEGIPVCTNEGESPSPRGDNSK